MSYGKSPKTQVMGSGLLDHTMLQKTGDLHYSRGAQNLKRALVPFSQSGLQRQKIVSRLREQPEKVTSGMHYKICRNSCLISVQYSTMARKVRLTCPEIYDFFG